MTMTDGRERRIVSLQAHRDRCDGRDEPLVGTFLANVPREQQLVEETIDEPCPFCGAALRTAVPGVEIERIVALDGGPIGDEQAVVVERIPSDHVVLSCRGCRQHWTRPR